MTYNEESSVLECISRHLKSFFRNDIFIELNEHYGVRCLDWVMNVSLCSLCWPSIWTNNVKWFLIYFYLFKCYAKINFFFHNSGSNQDIFILFEDLSSVDLGLFVGYLNL